MKQCKPESVWQLFLSPSPPLAADVQPELFQQTLHFYFYHYCRTLRLKLVDFNERTLTFHKMSTFRHFVIFLSLA